MHDGPLRVAVVGYGYWGPNLTRNVIERPELELAALCERDPARAAAFEQRVPGVPVVSELDRVLEDPTVDAVIVATPPRTHYSLVKASLEAGKHVLVEKPLARTAAEAADLVDIADRRGVVLMPGHTFLYSPPVNKVHELINQGSLGEIYFVTSSRMNLGKYQPDGVICDLAPHDISILLYLLDAPVTQVSAPARSIFREHNPEVAFLTITFEGGVTANVQISWLAPRKVREMVFVGSRDAWSSTTTRRPTSPCASSTGAWRSRRRPTSASSSSATAAATSSCRGSRRRSRSASSCRTSRARCAPA